MTRRRWAAVAIAVVVLVVVGVVIVYRPRSDSPTVRASDGSRLSTCGKQPRSRGSLGARLALAVTAPTTAESGTRITVDVGLRAPATPVPAFEAGAPADVVIVRDGYVVGRYSGSVGGTGLGGAVGKAPHTVPTDPVLLSGCPSSSIDFAHPDASRRALPAGRYGLVAVLDSEGRRFSFRVVSPARMIRVDT